MGEARRRKLAGYLAGERLFQRTDGSYDLTLRQCIYLAMKSDAPNSVTLAISRFVDALGLALEGPDASDEDKIEMFVAWLKGNVKGADAAVTMGMQHMAEKLHQAAPDAIDLFSAMARKEQEMRH